MEVSLGGLQPYLSFLGSYLQVGSSVLLIALFLLLRPYASRRHYFTTWAYAWIALSIALAMIMIRYNILPVFAGALQPTDTGLRVRAMYFLYQLGKVSFYGLLVAGTLRYVRSAPRFPSVAGYASFALLFSTFSVWQSSNLGHIVVWQAPVAVVSLGYACYLMLTLPGSRRSVGSSLAGACFAFGALIWLLYPAAFLHYGRQIELLNAVVNYNTYLDLTWHITLGFGMVVLLMEDVKHEVDAAHAELAVAHDNLRRASFYDTVTGSLNRQAYAEGLGLEAARAGFGSVVVLDTDNLKNINDDHGHAAGDRMLRHLVDVLRLTLRPSDKLYRWGGDEFLIVLPGADALHAARRMKTFLATAEPMVLPGGEELHICVSVGAAPYSSAEDLDRAIEAADRAMYADKAARKRSPGADVVQSA